MIGARVQVLLHTPHHRLRVAVGYFTTHAARLDYPRFVARRIVISAAEDIGMADPRAQ